MARRGEPQPQLVGLIRKARRAQAAVDSTDDFDLKLMAREFKCSTERFCRLLRLN